MRTSFLSLSLFLPSKELPTDYLRWFSSADTAGDVGGSLQGLMWVSLGMGSRELQPLPVLLNFPLLRSHRLFSRHQNLGEAWDVYTQPYL